MNNKNIDAFVLAMLSQVVKDKPIQNMLATEAFLQAETPLMQKAAYDNLLKVRQ